MNENEAAVLIYKMVEALNALHKAGFVHRDLKLENIMLANRTQDDYQLKLVDFGFAEVINDKELKSKAGTPGYIAPEVFKGQPYLAKGDMFSVGVILYSLISG